METKILSLKKIAKPSVFQANERKNRHLKETRHSPLVNIIERDNNYLLTIAIPGFKREELLIAIHKRILYTWAVKPSSTSNCVIDRYEYDYTKWNRSFILPGDADVIFTMAKYNEGELAILVPKGNTVTVSDPLIIYVY
jgi:HSP20 family protein